LAARIRETAGVDSTLVPSSGGAFEIRVNDELLHSKLQSGEWPDFDAIAREVKARL
jgi:selenoprotein W-related protein